MNFSMNSKLISLDHLSIGSRRSGSWSGEAAEDMVVGLEVDPVVVEWASSAGDGDRYDLGCGLFLTCWFS
jgi:hypothetical protein